MIFKLELHVNLINLALKALMKAPYEESAITIHEIQRQMQEQSKPQGVPNLPDKQASE